MFKRKNARSVQKGARRDQAEVKSNQKVVQKNKAEAKLPKAEAELLKAKAKKIKAKPQKILARAKRKKPQPIKLSKDALAKDILKEAKILGISSETAQEYVKIVSGKVANWAKKRAIVTQTDINNQIAKEIKKYNKDLAFIYNNKGKII